ncbi:MAG: ribonuclease HII [Thermoplasmata archaeon]|nr:ribonuclease HII [Thermoplasmata archaeon]
MICGVDEAGRGPVLGPLVVASVAIEREDERELRRLGVKDSKRLTPRRREELSGIIRKRWPYHITSVSADDIDLLRQEMTMNVLESRVFAGVIDKLEGTVHAYVDAADSNEEGFAVQIRSRLKRPIIITSRHKADDTYPVVGAASIVAKAERDRVMAEIGRELGGGVGSGYPSDGVTIAFIEKWVDEHGDLPPYTRRSWKTAQRILSSAKNKKIEDFGGN